MSTMFEFITDILAPKTRISRVIVVLFMSSVVATASITILFSELKKQDISKNQLEIEKSRVAQIDKQLSNLYLNAYSSKDSSTTTREYDQSRFLKQVEFFKNQRAEAVKSIDDINKSPDTQLMIFTLLAVALTIVSLVFFSSSFKASTTLSTRANLEKYSSDQGRKVLKKNEDFLHWVVTNELAENSISNAEIERAKMLKILYDQSEVLGEHRNMFLNTVIQYTTLTRNQDEIINNKYSDIILIFNEIQERIKDECNRLNKHAIINLFLCFFIAFVLMTLITYTSIFSTEISNSTSLETFIVRYLPRIIAVIGLLTMFLYFTKLYKTNILDVKYYQNELTNIEIMQVSWQTAVIYGDKDVLNKLLNDLSNIDRNKIISKEQTSIEIERIKLENEINKDYLGKVYDLLSLSRSPKNVSNEN